MASQLVSEVNTVSNRGAHLILGARGEALFRNWRFFRKRRSLNIVQKT